MKTVLVTGFEPFGGMPLNPALETIRALNGTQIMDGFAVFQKVCVPAVHNKYPII
ncbi:hypothetical protein [uncultured Endozoicomonas sp.]|uniref:pyroglutamyl-peptidase I family protein n=1 Tax=uncultured Endozoicomonas sp. TaxID=432652 RepID=UPI00261CCFC3|nr:hypothetical protein [uncultured Endozoicomonas sp.]